MQTIWKCRWELGTVQNMHDTIIQFEHSLKHSNPFPTFVQEFIEKKLDYAWKDLWEFYSDLSEDSETAGWLE